MQLLAMRDISLQCRLSVVVSLTAHYGNWCVTSSGMVPSYPLFLLHLRRLLSSGFYKGAIPSYTGTYAAFLPFFFLEARATFLSSCSRLLVIGSLATFNAVLETPLRRFKDCNWSCKASIRASS